MSRHGVNHIDDIPDIAAEIARELAEDDDLNMYDFGTTSVPKKRSKSKRSPKAKRNNSKKKSKGKRSPAQSKKKSKSKRVVESGSDSDEFALPDWESESRKMDKRKPKRTKPKPKWGKGEGSPKTIKNQIKAGKGYTSGRSKKKRDNSDSDDDGGYSNDRNRGVVDRLTDSRGYGVTHKKRFNKGGKKDKDEDNIHDLSKITRGGLDDKRSSRGKRIGKFEDDGSSLSGDTDDSYNGDLLCDDDDVGAEELDADDQEALKRQIMRELEDDSLGIPDYKNGKYKKKGYVAKKKKKKSSKPKKEESKRAQLLRGKNIVSHREQEELDREAAREAAKIKICKMKSCEELVHKSNYCVHHFNLYLKKAPKKKEIVQPEEECYGCGDLVVGKMIKAMDQWWHEDCFACKHCRNKFPGGKFVRMNKQPYCKPCAQELSGGGSSGGSRGGSRKKPNQRGGGRSAAGDGGGSKERCRGCNRVVSKQGIRACGGLWHKECFVCTYCASQFPGGKFVTDKSKNPYCNQECFESALGL